MSGPGDFDGCMEEELLDVCCTAAPDEPSPCADIFAQKAFGYTQQQKTKGGEQEKQAHATESSNTEKQAGEIISNFIDK